MGAPIIILQARQYNYRGAHVNIMRRARQYNYIWARVHNDVRWRVYNDVARANKHHYIHARQYIHILTCRAHQYSGVPRQYICSWREGKQAVGDGSYRENSCSAAEVILEICDKFGVPTWIYIRSIDIYGHISMRTEAFRAGTTLSFPEMGVLNFSYSLGGSREECHDSHRCAIIDISLYIIRFIYKYVYI